MKKQLILLPILLLSSGILVAMNTTSKSSKFLDDKIESEKLNNESKKLLTKIEQDDKKFEQLSVHIAKSLELLAKGLTAEAKERLEHAKEILSAQTKKHIKARADRLKNPNIKEQLKEQYKNPSVDEQLKKDDEKVKSLEKQAQELAK